jgi:hypothetical protein
MSKLTIYHIVVREPGGDAFWIEDCWDEWTLDENPGGFDESIEKIKETHGADNVRVLGINVPEDALQRPFYTTVIDGDVSEDVS